MSRFAPFTGFGDDPSTSIKFRILPGDAMPDWQGGPRLNIRKIPGGKRVNIRNTGGDPYTVSIRLAFDCRSDFDRMDAAQGTQAALRYSWGETRRAGGHYEDIQGRAYLTIPGVWLMGLEDPRRLPDGTVKVTASFLREAP